ncbi:MAG: alpha/beta fold hydrolase [Burkholderiaceae bacterium]|jgi:pimeloyl-ACP methyl ester carboxylesterase|nr:alpha/beta fold hydrolase [Burkholderiaceae bacterium]
MPVRQPHVQRLSTRLPFVAASLAIIALLSACASGDDEPLPPPPPTGGPDDPGAERGTLLASAPYLTWTRGEIDGLSSSGLEGLLLREVVGKARCDVELHAIEYQTVGGAGEPVNATGGIAIPTGEDPACNAPRPLVMWAHGTDAGRDYSVLTNEEVFGGIALAVLAAHGYAVVAPDYTGYGGSRLDYHPYLNAQAQAADAIDSLRAARAFIAARGEPAPQALYLTGYSQGGYVAMATHREIERSHGDEFQVDASFPMSGPYALSATLDRMLGGDPTAGASRLMPFLVESYQRSYGNVFTDPVELFVPPYDRTAIGLFPGDIGSNGAIEQGLLPPYLLAAEGSPFLMQPAWVDNYLLDPDNPMRQDVAANDLRGWAPAGRLAMCGGGEDTVVHFENTRLAQQAFAEAGVPVTVFDFDTGDSIPGGTDSSLYLMFRSLFLLPGNEDAYHIALAPFCARIARDFFAGAVQ